MTYRFFGMLVGGNIDLFSIYSFLASTWFDFFKSCKFCQLLRWLRIKHAKRQKYYTTKISAEMSLPKNKHIIHQILVKKLANLVDTLQRTFLTNACKFK